MVNVNTIEEIHKEFSFDLLGLVDGYNDISGLVQADQIDLLKKIKPVLMPTQRFANFIEYYRYKYPTYNFVTEHQITDICVKYGLVFGSLMGFSAVIPVKNRLEISRFKLANQDSMYVDHELPGKIYRLAVTNGINGTMSFPERGGGGIIEFRTGYVPSDPTRVFEVVPVGEHFTLVRNLDDRTFRVYFETEVHGSPWIVHFGDVSIDKGEVWMEWRLLWQGSQRIQASEVSLKLTVDRIQRSNRLSLMRDVSPMVVADQSMFKRFGEATEIVGHRVKFKRSQVPANVVFGYVDDPIILQPVPGGYLVVTKWGAEANIPEVVSGQSN